MAHFAKISESNDVLNVVVLDNKNCQDENGVENESIGQQFLESKLSWPANLWIQSSYNTSANQHKLGGTPLRGNWHSPVIHGIQLMKYFGHLHLIRLG